VHPFGSLLSEPLGRARPALEPCPSISDVMRYLTGHDRPLVRTMYHVAEPESCHLAVSTAPSFAGPSPAMGRYPTGARSDRWAKRVRMTPGILRAVGHNLRARRVSMRAYISPGTQLMGGNIRIDRSVYIGPMCYLEANNGGVVRLHQSVDIGPGCVLLTTSHNVGQPAGRAGEFLTQDIVIERGCWLGAAVTVLPGTRLGSGCVVGASTLLRGEYPPNSLIVGIPGRVVRTLENASAPDTGA
jgi:maltose O-acetyltransferase